MSHIIVQPITESVRSYNQGNGTKPASGRFVHRLTTCSLLTLLIVSSVEAMAGEPTGRWQGRWTSATTGHSGPMRARISSNADGSYRALFTGRFAVVIPFAYRTVLQPVYTGAGTTYWVDKRLGPLLGSYRMQANIPGNSFSANYSAAGDAGQIVMQRKSY